MGICLLSPNKLRAALQIAIVALFFYAGAAYPEEKKMQCGELKPQLSNLYINGFSFVSTAEAYNGLVTQLFVNVNTCEWVLLGIDSDLHVCQLLIGSGFRFSIGQEL